MQVVSGFGYILTYEKVRHILAKNDINDNRIRGLIAGGCGSLVSQTIICKFLKFFFELFTKLPLSIQAHSMSFLNISC